MTGIAWAIAVAGFFVGFGLLCGLGAIANAIKTQPREPRPMPAPQSHTAPGWTGRG